MALLHADGFDHYGTTADAATQQRLAADGYTAYSNLYVHGVKVISGKTYSPSPGIGWLYFPQCDRCYFRRPVNVANTHWAHFRLLFTAVPDQATTAFKFLDAAGAAFLAWVAFLPDNSITIGRGTSTNFAAGYDIKIPKAYLIGSAQCWEIIYTANTAGAAPYNGSLAVYRDGALIAQALQLNIAACGLHEFGAEPILGGSQNVFFRDYIIGDTTGAYNNAPFGPRRVGFRVANGVGASNDWAVGGGAANAAVATNANPFQINTYIEAANVGDTTELTLPASSQVLNGVMGVMIKSYMSKTNVTSPVSVKLGIRSGVAALYGPDQVPGFGYTYINSAWLETDPNTGGPGFTPAAYNALSMMIQRSA